MANEAVINFLFNTEGANRELNNFKTRFNDAIKGIEDSGIGKFAALGSAIAGAFSIKSFVDYTHTLAEFGDVFTNMPVEKIGRFANLMKLMNRKADYNETISALSSVQKKINQLRIEGGNMPKLWQMLDIKPHENGRWKSAIEIMDEVIKKYRQFQKEHKDNPIEQQLLTQMFDEMGLSQPIQTSMARIMNASEEQFAETYKDLDKMFTPSREDADNVLKFEQALTKLNNAFERLGSTLIQNGFVTDVVNGFTKAVEKFTELPPDTQTKIMGIGTALVGLAPGLKLFSSFVSLCKGLGALVGPWGMLAIAILAVATNIGGIKDTLEELHKKYDDWIASIENKHPVLAKFLRETSDLITAVLHPIETFQKAWNNIKQTVQDLKNMLPELWKEFGFGDKHDEDAGKVVDAVAGQKSWPARALQSAQDWVLNLAGYERPVNTQTPISNNTSNSNQTNNISINVKDAKQASEVAKEVMEKSRGQCINLNEQMPFGFSGGRFGR